MYKTREYNSWDNMIARCYRESNPRYDLYGGRGITVCEEWRNSFLAFYKDMGERPEGMSLDRIDVNGNYEPSNCKWSTALEQGRNQNMPRTNTSGHVGVVFAKSRNKWTAQIGCKGKVYRLGYFLNIEDAIAARAQGEKKYRGVA